MDESKLFWESEMLEKTQAYRIYREIILTILILIGIFEGLTIIINTKEVYLSAEWNMFNSMLLWPLLIAGLFVTLGTQFSGFNVFSTTKYRGGGKQVECSQNLVNTVDSGCLSVILYYLVFGPLMFAAIIYYPLMVVISYFNVIIPYIFGALLMVGIPFLYWRFTEKIFFKPNRHILIPLISTLFVLLACYGMFFWNIIASFSFLFNVVYNVVIVCGLGIIAFVVFVVLELRSVPDTTNNFIEKPIKVRIPKEERVSNGEKYGYVLAHPNAWKEYGVGKKENLKGIMIPLILTICFFVLPLPNAGKICCERDKLMTNTKITISSDMKKANSLKSNYGKTDLDSMEIAISMSNMAGGYYSGLYGDEIIFYYIDPKLEY